jgi:hypothetical protein
VNAKISYPKYWLMVVGVVVMYSIVAKYLSPMVTYIIYVVVLAITYRSITKLKKRGKDQLTGKDKARMVLFMAFEPVVGQALYYYRLKKQMPISASIALWIGWKVLLLFLVGIAIFIVMTVTQSWNYRYNVSFQSNLDNISADLNSITKASDQSDGTKLLAGCQKLAVEVASTQKLPAYPDDQIQSKLSGALNKLSKGAIDCEKAVTAADPSLLKQSNGELKNGYSDLKSVVKLMKSDS